MFTPKWKKDAQNVLKQGKKFLNFKRDLLEPSRIDEIASRIDDLKNALKERGSDQKKKVAEAIKQLDSTCENSLPRSAKPDPIAENIEVIFVSLVVALGIRSYYVQPFKIPTGSMQPTLNGVICKAKEKQDWPNPIVRVVEFGLRGRNYVHKKAPKDLIVPREFVQAYRRGLIPGQFITQNPGFWTRLATFHTVSAIHFKNGTLFAHGVPANDLLANPEITLANVIFKHGVPMSNGDIRIPQGTVLYSGHADSGDLILADKVSYHFRKPKRGETFIFDTRGIDTKGGSGQAKKLSDQKDAQHYIKRCVGVPGDTLQIDTPNLLVNGHPAEEKYIQRVSEAKGYYEGTPGYIVATKNNTAPLRSPDQKLVLSDSKRSPWRAEYAAMGDNTQNSLDSRYWGALEEYNVVAPALFTLWPITTGHWGFIK